VTFPLPYHGESTKGITFRKPRKGSDGYNGYTKYLAKHFSKILQQLETKLE
jgi:hypothetical protein